MADTTANSLPPNPPRTPRTGLTREEIQQDLLDNLFFDLGKFPEVATLNDWYVAAALTVRDRLMDRWIQSVKSYWQEKRRTVCYFSAEFLIGPQLAMGVLDLGIENSIDKILREYGLTLEQLTDHEEKSLRTIPRFRRNGGA